MTEVNRKLPPMSVLEDAIRRVFGNLGFALRLTLAWAIILVPLGLAVMKLAGDLAEFDVWNLPSRVKAGAGAFALVAFFAFLSITVNWHRRLLLDETPRRLAWWRLNRPVWRYLVNLIFVLLVTGLLAAGAAAIVVKLSPLLTEKIGKPGPAIAYFAAAILGMLALTNWYRLAIKLPAAAIGRKDFGFAAARRATRWNTWRLLGLTFWYLFALAICGAIGAAAYFGQKLLAESPVTAAAYAVIGLIVWFALLLTMTLSASLYAYVGENRDFPPPQ